MTTVVLVSIFFLQVSNWFLSSLIPVINILGKSVYLNEVAIHTSSDVAVENAKNVIHNLGHLKQDSNPRYSMTLLCCYYFLIVQFYKSLGLTKQHCLHVCLLNNNEISVFVVRYFNDTNLSQDYKKGLHVLLTNKKIYVLSITHS